MRCPICRSFAILSTAAVGALLAAACAGAAVGHAAADTVQITSGPAGETTATSATFTFTGAGAVTDFRCLLDSAPTPSPCTSPAVVSGLLPGVHTFAVLGYRGDVPVGVADRRQWTVVSSPPAPPPVQPSPPVPAPAPVPVVPDFTLSYDPLAKALPLAAVPGGSSIELGVLVSRLYGSSGQLSVKVSKLPAGVTLYVVKDVQTNPTRFALRLGTHAFAKPGLGVLAFTVTPETPASGQLSRSLLIPFAVVEQYDLAVTGIEITQGIQRVWSEQSALPARDPAAPGKPIVYPDGIQLGPCEGTSPVFPTCLVPSKGAATIVRGKRTVVRAFAVAASAAGVGMAPGKVTMLLHGRAVGGAALPGSPLQSKNVTSVESGDPLAVPLAALLSSQGAFQFSLPSSWTKVKQLELTAEVVPPVLYGAAECTSPACAANNRITLTSIEPRNTGFVNVWNIGFVDVNGAALQPPSSVYAAAARLLPLAEGELRTAPYRALVDASPLFAATTLGELFLICPIGVNCKDSDVDRVTRTRDKLLLEIVDDFAHPAGCGFPAGAVGDAASCPDFVAGIAPGNSYGLSRGRIGYRIPINVVNQSRPLTSVGHELVHGLGARHADHACGGNDKGQEAEPWWPDWWGQIAGIGLGTAPGNSLFPVVHSGQGPKAKGDPDFRVYDLMSYCAGDGKNGWISTINWERAAKWLPTLHGPSASAQAARHGLLADEQVLLVRGFVVDGRVVVTTVRPTRGTPFVGPPESSYRVVLRGNGEEVIDEAPLLVGVGDAHGGSSDIQVEARLPLAGVDASRLPTGLRAVEVVRDGAFVGGVTRSMSRPVVDLVAPSAGARVGGNGKAVHVVWTAEDADGTQLRSRVEYSSDGGATWRQVWTGQAAGPATLPAHMLPASTDARLRVAVSDGFDETIAISQRFVSLGSSPEVEIVAPGRREELTAGTPVDLAAVAWADDGTRVAPAAISWWEGPRQIAQGGSANALLRPGRHLLRAVARDGHGREGQATIRVRVVAPAPAVLVRGAPARVSRTARSIPLRLASTVAARGSARGAGVVGASHFTLSPQPRLVRVPVRPGVGPLLIRLSAFADGKSATVALTIRRG